MPGWAELGSGVQARYSRLRFGLLALSQSYAREMVAQMRREAPWQNRTGDARNYLYAIPYQRDNEVGIDLGHGVQYGIYLEEGTRYMRMPPADPTSSGRPSVVYATALVGYPIVHPTAEAFRPRYFEACQRLMQRTMSGQG